MFKLKCAMLFATAFIFMLGNISAMRHQDDDSKKPRMPKFEKDFYNNHYDDSETEEEQGSIVYSTQSSNSQRPNVQTPETRRMEEENLRLLNRYSDYTTEEDPELRRIYDSPTYNSEISETEEMQVEHAPNPQVMVEDNFKFTVMPKFEIPLTNNYQEDSDTEDEQQIYVPANTLNNRAEEDFETEEMEEDLYIVNKREPHQFFIHPHLRFAPRHRNDYEQTAAELNKLMNLFQTETPRDEDWYELHTMFDNGAIHIGNFFHHDEDRRRITTEYMRNMNTLYRYMYRYNLLQRFPHIKKFFDRWAKKERI